MTFICLMCLPCHDCLFSSPVPVINVCENCGKYSIACQKKILKIPWFTVNGSAPRGGHGGSFPRWAALSFDRKTSSGRLSEIATGDYYRRLPQTSRLLIKFIKLKSVDLIILITNSCLLHFTLQCVSFCLLASLLCK